MESIKLLIHELTALDDANIENKLSIEVNNRVNALERILSNDPGNRGLARAFSATKGSLLKTILTLYRAKNVLVSTGFYVRAGCAGETDGPAGAAAIGRAVSALGNSVTILTDPACAPVVYACVDQLKKQCSQSQHLISFVTYPGPYVKEAKHQHILGEDWPSKAAMLDQTHNEFIKNKEKEEKYIDKFLKKNEFDCLVSIERLSQSVDGQYANMRGVNLADICGRLDNIFQHAQCSTIGIGDGGNEVGMGNIADLIIQDIKYGPTIVAKTKVNALIVAGVSNWAGYAIAAGITLLNRVISGARSEGTLPSESEEHEMMKSILSAGSVDGATQTNKDFSVDGIGFDFHMKVLSTMREIAEMDLDQEFVLDVEFMKTPPLLEMPQKELL